MYHCDYCSCPKEDWEPLKNYPCDRSCVLYDDFYDLIYKYEKKKTPFTFDDILNQMNQLSSKYPDIADFRPVTEEMVEIHVDLGVMPMDLYRPCTGTNGEGR